MLALGDVVDRIRQMAPSARHVAHGLAADTPPQLPAVYVYPLAEASDPPPTLGPVRQRVVVRIAAEIIVSSPRGARSGRGAADLADAVRAEVLAALIGWQPDWADEALTHERGRLMQMEAGWASWRDEFVTRMTRM